MHKKLALSIAMAVIGAGLLVGASFAGAASASAPAKAGSTEAKRGGTLRINVSNTDFEFIDPALAYDALGWQVLYMTNLMLLRLPGQAGAGGLAARAGGGRGLPARSRSDGKTYTFTVRKRAQLQRRLGRDRGRVQAGLRARGRSEAGLAGDRVHARRRRRRRPQRGQGRLGHRRRREGPDADDQADRRPTRRSSPRSRCRSSSAVKPSMAIDPKGINVYPSGRSVPDRQPRDRVASSCSSGTASTRATAPRTPTGSSITANTDLNQSLLQVRAGQVDYDAGGLPPTAHDEPVAASSASRRAGTAATSSTPVINTTYLALNTIRPAAREGSNLRKAVNYAIDRPALLRVAGKFAGKRTDQILPPNMRGFRRGGHLPDQGRRTRRGPSSSRRGRQRRHHDPAHDVSRRSIARLRSLSTT